MRYEEAVSVVRLLEGKGSVYGPERAALLLERLGNPQDNFKIVHVAGTNGKGSVCAFLTRILVCAGKTVGTFTSPAVFDYRERYLINGAYPEKEALAEALTRALALRGEATAFDTEFAAAMALFQSAGCEYAVVECGCGGREDSTNALGAKNVAVLASVSYDHTALLGHTLAEIARHKAGIVKNCPLVTCEQPAEAMAVIEPLRPVVVREYRGEIGLSGAFQRTNAALAATAARLLGIGFDAIEEGVRTAIWHGRCEVIPCGRHTFVLDGAHNVGAARALKESLKELFPERRLRFVMGMFADKDVDGVLSVLLRDAASFAAVRAAPPRGMAPEELRRRAQAYCNETKISSIEEEIKRALSEDGTTIVCGSLSVLREARRCIDEQTKGNAGDL